MTLKLKIDTKVMPIEAGWYILVFDPRETNVDEICRAFRRTDDDDNAPDVTFILIASRDPDSIRLLKAEEPGQLISGYEDRNHS